jgi:hypothetical protein
MGNRKRGRYPWEKRDKREREREKKVDMRAGLGGEEGGQKRRRSEGERHFVGGRTFVGAGLGCPCAGTPAGSWGGIRRSGWWCFVVCPVRDDGRTSDE